MCGRTVTDCWRSSSALPTGRHGPVTSTPRRRLLTPRVLDTLRVNRNDDFTYGGIDVSSGSLDRSQAVSDSFAAP